MASRTDKAREAKVRASRAKSRVVARRRSRAEYVRRESLEKIAATYERAREKLSSRTAQEADVTPPVEKKTERIERAERSKKEKDNKYGPLAQERREPASKDASRKESDAGKKGKHRRKSGGDISNEASPAPAAKRALRKAHKVEKGSVEKGRSFRQIKEGSRRKREVEKGSGRDGVSAMHSPHGLAAEEAEKKRRGRSRTSRIAVLGSLLFISLGALLWVYTATGVLNIKSVEVKGNEKLDEAYLRTLSGITQQNHLLKLDVGAVERALLSEPYVAAVEVSRSFPNKVVLEITERRPLAFILQNEGYNLVDGEGMVLETVEDRPQGLVEIRDLDLALLIPGSVVSDRDFAVVNSLLASLPPSLQEMTATAGYIDGEGLYIESGETIVIYGDESELTYKNTIALLALANLMDRYGTVEYIDVSFPDNPVIKPAGN
jgi:cell division protein FtsQ